MAASVRPAATAALSAATAAFVAPVQRPASGATAQFVAASRGWRHVPASATATDSRAALRSRCVSSRAPCGVDACASGKAAATTRYALVRRACGCAVAAAAAGATAGALLLQQRGRRGRRRRGSSGGCAGAGADVVGCTRHGVGVGGAAAGAGSSSMLCSGAAMAASACSMSFSPPMLSVDRRSLQQRGRGWEGPYIFCDRFRCSQGRHRRLQAALQPPARAATLGRPALKLPDIGWDAPWDIDSRTRNKEMIMTTLTRVVLPTVFAFVGGGFLYVPIAMGMQSALDIGNTGEGPILELLGMDQSQFMQNFLTVNGLLFTILVGNTYTSLYNQQERLYHALFLEVSEAKSLLEQGCILCQGRSSYPQILESIGKYVSRDLRRLEAEPSEILAGRPMDDPLESILYVTSVGVPSIIYDTVRDLRQARGQRLGAMQRKLPAIHFALLYVLGALELLAFPLLGAGTASIVQGEQNVLAIQGVLFGAMSGAIVMTLQVCYELWQPFGGAYTVDSVLNTMVHGLEEELQARRELAVQSGWIGAPATTTTSPRAHISNGAHSARASVARAADSSPGGV